MSELISGKEALSRVHECVVQYKCDTDPVEDRWTTITDNFWDQYNLGVFLNKDTTWKFRLKPRTIVLNGIELPKPQSVAHCSQYPTAVEIDFDTEEQAIEFKTKFSNLW